MAIGRRAHMGMALVCGSCRRRFHSTTELQRHRSSSLCSDKERYGCPHCSKDFGNRQILRLHMRVHEETTTPPAPAVPSTQSTPETNVISESNKETWDMTTENSTGLVKPAIAPPPAYHQGLYGNTKKIGFTKIRLEDCLRCDECSCVYMDESDYLKHMRNFHRNDSPRKSSKQKKGCRSCCKHCNCKDAQPSVETERGNNNLFHFNIKDRWSKVVSRRLAGPCIKQEDEDDPLSAAISATPGLDLSHLLSQVEVKIKTEPPDYYELPEEMSTELLAAIKTEPTS